MGVPLGIFPSLAREGVQRACRVKHPLAWMIPCTGAQRLRGVPGSQRIVYGVAQHDLGHGQDFLECGGELQVPPVQLQRAGDVVVAGI